MVQRLLLDGIDTESGAFAPGRELHLSVDILADKTEASVTRFHVAFARAQVADDPAVSLGFVPPSTVNRTRCVGRRMSWHKHIFLHQSSSWDHSLQFFPVYSDSFFNRPANAIVRRNHWSPADFH